MRTSPQHVTAQDAAHILPDEPVWCFSVVRDPVERIVSEFQIQARSKLRRKNLTKFGFSVWLATVFRATRYDGALFDNHIRPQSDIVPVGAEVFRFENGFSDLIYRVDMVTGKSAAKFKIGKKLVRNSKKSVHLTDWDRKLIGNFYTDDYIRFGFLEPVLHGKRHYNYIASAIAWLLGYAVAKNYRKGHI